MEPSRGEEVATSTTPSGVVRSCAIETPPVRSLFRVLKAPRTAWTTATSSVVTGGATATLTATGEDRFEQLQTSAERLFSNLEIPDSLPYHARPRLFGGFSFTDTQPSEATTHTGDNRNGDGKASVWDGFYSAQFVLPAVQIHVSSDGAWLTTTALGPDATAEATSRLNHWQARLGSLPEPANSTPPGIQSQQHTPLLTEWHERVTSVTDRIQRGELQKVVLAQSLRLSLQKDLHVIDALARLGEVYPSCYQFLFEPADSATFFGATPERLVSVRGQTVETEALAGSIGRGETQEEDEWLETTLRESEKNNHEHDLVVDTIRQQLRDVADAITTGKQTVRKLSNVQHLQTPLQATLDRERHVLELVERLHPTPAVGGLPLDAATRTIRDLEGFNRGWYASPVGWVDSNGDGTFVVGIRSAVADGRTAMLFAGAGIVADSDPDEEWDELQLKFRPILDELR